MLAAAPARTSGKLMRMAASAGWSPTLPRNRRRAHSISAMHADPETLFAVVAAMVGGLMGFAVLLLAGVALVHALRLPQDLPDGPRFEPPPPPLQPRGERGLALKAAQRQAVVAALYARARELEHGGRECQALMGALATAPVQAGASAGLAQRLQAATEACAAVATAMRAFDGSLRAAPLSDAGSEAFAAALAAREPEVQDALAAARKVAADPAAPGPGRHRLLLLFAFLLLWLAALAALLWR
jgi:hypothetical protein